MNKIEFREKLINAIVRFGPKDISPEVSLYEVHAPNAKPNPVSIDEALNVIYISEDKFYKIVDISFIKRQKSEFDDSTMDIIFVRVSGHEPVLLENTWGGVASGPFKYIEWMDDR